MSVFPHERFSLALQTICVGSGQLNMLCRYMFIIVFPVCNIVFDAITYVLAVVINAVPGITASDLRIKLYPKH